MKVYHGREAARVHQYQIQQERTEASLLQERRRRLRNALKYNLRHHVSGAITDNKGRIKPWFESKLDSLMAYGMMDVKCVTTRQHDMARNYFCDGASTRQLSLAYGITQRQVQKDIAHVLNVVIDTAPRTLTRLLCLSIAQYILNGCSNCHDTLEWDRDGAHDGGEGEYVCMHCGRRFTFELQLIN